MFVVSNIVAVLRIFHVLFPIWILLCFVASSHNLLMAHMVFFWVDGACHWWSAMENWHPKLQLQLLSGDCSYPTCWVLLGRRNRDCFRAALFGGYCLHVLCWNHNNLSCDLKKQKMVLWLKHSWGRQVEAQTCSEGKIPVKEKMVWMSWLLTTLLWSCTRIFFQKMVLLPLKLHPMCLTG